MKSLEKFCEECKHYDSGISKEPCKSCYLDAKKPNWEHWHTK